MSLQLLVNGTAVGEAAANAELSVPADTLPAYPWHVAAKTDGGRTLAILEVTGDVERTTLPDGSTQVNGYGTTAYLSCGQLVLSYGPPPLGGPPTGPAGDCM
jgi:hypothetical protein